MSMQERTPRLPRYRRHRPSGQAVVTLSGRDYYLGPYGTKASKAEYDRLTAEWLASGRMLHKTTGGKSDYSLNELTALYLRFAKGYYVKEGKQTTAVNSIRLAVRPLCRLYGTTPAAEFGPLALQAVRSEMIRMDWCRSMINDSVRRLVGMFKWLVAQELLPPSVYQALKAVSGLAKGRTQARESEPVRPVDDMHVDAIKPFVPPTIWTMIRLQRLTGMRPGEVCTMRACDIDTTADLWEYRPSRHKTQHHELDRVVPLGQQAQELIRPYLKQDTTAYLFTPAEAVQQRAAQAKTHRRKNQKPSRRTTQRRVGAYYDVAAYRRAIAYGCDRAFPLPEHLQRQRGEGYRDYRNRLTEQQKTEIAAWRDAHHWHPNQIRHTFATQVRKHYGLEAAQVALGHSKANVTQIYAEKNLELARDVMRKIG